MIAKLLLFAVALTAVKANAVESRLGNQNTYYLYTLSNPLSPITIQASDFAVEGAVPALTNVNTVVIVHGHGGDAFTTLNPSVRNALLLREEAINIIVVDWSPFSKLSYSSAVTAVPSVGVAIAELLSALVEATRISLGNVHLVGFNLGAHVVGFTGRTLGGAVARITGLDPSGSQWGSNSPRLTQTDAAYVEVLHTDGDGLFANGIGTALGHVDFFANGGRSQPGCANNACCHNRAWELFTASLVRESPLLGYPCRSNLQMVLNTCRGVPAAFGGVELFKLITPGTYRLNTGRNFPY